VTGLKIPVREISRVKLPESRLPQEHRVIYKNASIVLIKAYYYGQVRQTWVWSSFNQESFISQTSKLPAFQRISHLKSQHFIVLTHLLFSISLSLVIPTSLCRCWATEDLFDLNYPNFNFDFN
jgi:hypothetical protein